VLRLNDPATIGAVDRKVGGIEFYQNDASGGAGIGSSIAAHHVNISGDTDLRFATGDNTERMRIDSDGKVGIGHSSPSTQLMIDTGDTNSILGVNSPLSSSAFSQLILHHGPQGDWYTNSVVAWQLFSDCDGTDATFRMSYFDGSAYTHTLYMLPSGNVGIGTDSPSSKLDVRNGYILTGTAASTAGTKLLAGYYNSSGDEAVTIGTSRSSAALVLGYGCFPSSTTADAFLSSADNVAWDRGAVSISDRFVYRNAVGTTTTVGDPVTLTERFRIAENGYIGVNTNSPQHLLDVGSGSASAPTHKGHIRLGGGALTNSGHGGIEFRGSTFGSGYGWRIQNEDPGGQTPLVISSRENSTTWTEVARFRGNAVGGGIAFNGDTTAQNALDDYEEGTWTPTLGTGTITSYEANYTKIGNVVHVQIYINGVSDISTAANFIVSLPYASKSGARSPGSIMFRNIDTEGASQISGATADSQLNTYVGSSSSNLYLYISRNQGSGYVNLQHNDFTNSGVDMFMSLTYIAA